MNRISEPTRRDIIDAMVVERVRWSGRLEEPDFLSRLFDLNSLPSHDHRYTTAYADIHKHQVMNNDWEPDWVFYDSCFNFLHGDDEVFLRFLCEMLHPVVRSDIEEVQRLRQAFNGYLRQDGYELVEKMRLSRRPVFAAKQIDAPESQVMETIKEQFRVLDSDYVMQQITRMEASVFDDPALAIGTAKELIETCFRTVLQERGKESDDKWDLSQLVKNTSRELKLIPENIPAPDEAKAAETVRRVLGNLASITQGIAELRNAYGTGHGKGASHRGLSPRHAGLAVGAASTLAIFLVQTHREQIETMDG